MQIFENKYGELFMGVSLNTLMQHDRFRLDPNHADTFYKAYYSGEFTMCLHDDDDLDGVVALDGDQIVYIRE